MELEYSRLCILSTMMVYAIWLNPSHSSKMDYDHSSSKYFQDLQIANITLRLLSGFSLNHSCAVEAEQHSCFSTILPTQVYTAFSNATLATSSRKVKVEVTDVAITPNMSNPISQRSTESTSTQDFLLFDN